MHVSLCKRQCFYRENMTKRRFRNYSVLHVTSGHRLINCNDMKSVIDIQLIIFFDDDTNIHNYRGLLKTINYIL